MLTQNRHAQIMQLLREYDMVKVQDLIEELGVSESTVRRDLSELETQGQLLRVHGGAKRRTQLLGEQTYNEKKVLNLDVKRQIAQLAASFVQSDSVIYLDAGTTTLAMIPHLQSVMNLQVVTNSYHQAQRLLDYGIEPYLIGGRLRVRTHASVGAISLAQLRQFHFEQVFMGMNAVDTSFGYSTPDVEEAAVKRLAIQQADQAYVLVDHSKFDHRTLTHVAPLEQATIITTALDETRRMTYRQLTRIEEC